jgi:hypothetical protein
MGKTVLVVGAISPTLLTNKKQGKVFYKETISCYEPQEIYIRNIKFRVFFQQEGH